MPNWCNNVVSMTHDDPAMLERARAAFAQGGMLNEFIPCPQALLDPRSTAYGGPDAAENDRIRAGNEEAYGYASWYDWQVANWGTKWDIGNEDGARIVGDVLQLSFDSAWSPPVTAYWTLEAMGFGIKAFYYEPGMAFCGSWINGVDESYSIPSTAAEAEQVIPEEIDLAFDIVNSMAMWEEEEEA